MRRSWMSIAGALALFVGCGSNTPDDGSCAGDACVEIPDGGAGPPGMATPEIPWAADGVPPLAALAMPCPDGWREVPPAVEGDPVTCDPYPEGGPTPCPAGQAHFPGEPGCASIGTPCPSGDFADGLPTDRRVIYVRPGAMGGDGTESQPYGGFSEFARGSLPMGTVIALSRGRHDGPVQLSRQLELVGACVEATSIRATDPTTTEGVVTFFDSGGAMRDLTVSDSARAGVWAGGAATEGRVEGVAFERTRFVAVVAASGARLAIRSTVVRDTMPRSDGGLGRAMTVEVAESADVSRTLFERHHDATIFVRGMGTGLTVADVAVYDTSEQSSDGSHGRALSVELGAVADVRRTLFERSREVGVVASDGGTSLMLTDVVVRDTESRVAGDSGGNGLIAQGEAVLAVERATVERNRTHAVFANHTSTSVSLSDVVLRDTQSQASDGNFGRGLGVEGGASADARRAHIARNRDSAVFAQGTDTRLALADATVRDTDAAEGDGRRGGALGVQLGATADVRRATLERFRDHGILVAAAAATLEDVAVRDGRSRRNDGRFGRGLSVQEGGRLDGSRVLVSDTRDVGVFAQDADTSVTLLDAIVQDTQGRESDGDFGHGLAIQGGAIVVLTRTLLSANTNASILLNDAGTALTVTDGVVRDTVSRGDGRGGTGMAVQRGASANLVRVLLEGHRGLGVGALAGSSVTLEDVVIADTMEQACAETTCADRAGGMGVGSFMAGSMVEMTGFEVRDAALCGLHVAQDAELDARSGEVTRSAIGVCVQVDGYDIDRLTTDVRYDDNGVNLQATTLPVPDLVESAAPVDP